MSRTLKLIKISVLLKLLCSISTIDEVSYVVFLSLYPLLKFIEARSLKFRGLEQFNRQNYRNWRYAWFNDFLRHKRAGFPLWSYVCIGRQSEKPKIDNFPSGVIIFRNVLPEFLFAQLQLPTIFHSIDDDEYDIFFENHTN